MALSLKRPKLIKLLFFGLDFELALDELRHELRQRKAALVRQFTSGLLHGHRQIKVGGFIFRRPWHRRTLCA